MKTLFFNTRGVFVSVTSWTLTVTHWNTNTFGNENYSIYYCANQFIFIGWIFHKIHCLIETLCHAYNLKWFCTPLRCLVQCCSNQRLDLCRWCCSQRFEIEGRGTECTKTPCYCQSWLCWYHYFEGNIYNYWLSTANFGTITLGFLSIHILYTCSFVCFYTSEFIWIYEYMHMYILTHMFRLYK